MNQSNLYVPNPQKWIHYFKNHKPQVGKGFSIPYKSTSENHPASLKIVSPAQQTFEQAKSELKRDGIKTPENYSLVHKLKDLSSKTHQKKKPLL